jgi:hypothetical protein
MWTIASGPPQRLALAAVPSASTPEAVHADSRRASPRLPGRGAAFLFALPSEQNNHEPKY